MKHAAGLFLCVLFLSSLLIPGTVSAADSNKDGTEKIQAEEYLDETLDYSEIQDTLSTVFPDKKIDFGDTVQRIISGDLSVTGKLVRSLIFEQLFHAWTDNRKSLIHMVLIAVITAVFTNFADVLEAKQISEISFYFLYMLMLTICISGFQSAVQWTEDGIRLLSAFMKALCPVYFIAVSAAKGSLTAGAFYNLSLLVILAAELILLNVLLPFLQVYMMMKVMNHLSGEAYLTRFTELLETVLTWSMRTMLAFVIGLNTIQGLLAPALDQVKRSVVTRGVEAIPGVGDAMGGTAEVIIGTAVVVKNGIGIAGAVICFAICLSPLVQTGLLVLLYRLAAAVLQPVSDQRMVSCIAGMADACQLLMRLIFTAGMMFLLTIAIVAASTNGT